MKGSYRAFSKTLCHYSRLNFPPFPSPCLHPASILAFSPFKCIALTKLKAAFLGPFFTTVGFRTVTNGSWLVGLFIKDADFTGETWTALATRLDGTDAGNCELLERDNRSDELQLLQVYLAAILDCNNLFIGSMFYMRCCVSNSVSQVDSSAMPMTGNKEQQGVFQ